MNILVIDDERTFDTSKLMRRHNISSLCEGCEDKNCDWNKVFYAKTLLDAKDYFYYSWVEFDIIYLDHDLGNGEDVRKLTSEIEQDAHDGILYEVDKFIIHSMNPLGRKEMYDALHKFYNVEFARVEDLL